MRIISDPIKTSSFFSTNSKSRSSTPIFTHFENYIEFPEKGRLFGILNLNSIKDFDCLKCTHVIKSLIVSRFYNGPETTLIDALENTIADVKSELSQMVSVRRDELEGSLDLNCILLSVKNNTCYIANFGDSEIFLVREKKEFNLNNHLRDTLGRNQVRVASILLNEGDIVYITTPNTLNKIIDSKLRNCIDTFNFEKLNTTPLKSDPSGLGIFSFGYKLILPDTIVQTQFRTPKIEEVKEKPKPTLYPLKKESSNDKIVSENIVNSKLKAENAGRYHSEINVSINSNPISTNPSSRPGKGIDIEDKSSKHETVYERIQNERENQHYNSSGSKVLEDERYSSSNGTTYSKQRYKEGGEVGNVLNKKKINSSSRLIPGNVKNSSFKDITIFNGIIKSYYYAIYILKNFYQILLSALLKKRRKSFEKKVRSERFATSMKHFNSNVTASPSKIKRKYNLKILIPALILVIILISLFISNSMKLETEKKSRELTLTTTQNLIDDAKKLIVDSEKYASINKKKARELLTSADKKLVEAEGKSLVDFNSKIDELRKNSQIIIDKKIEKNIILDDTNVVQDFSSIYQSPIISGMEISGGKVYVGLKDGRLLESGSQTTANLSFINVLQNLEKISIDKISQDADGNILLYDEKQGLFRYNIASKSLSKVVNMTSTVVGNASTFLTAKINSREYLYFFNPITKDLFRSQRNGDAYLNPEVRIHDESFDKATSLSIDGRIWVSTRGLIKKYYDGVEEAVKFNQNSFDFPLNNITNIKVATDRLVLSDEGVKRVVIFSKIEALTENSLNYLASYILKSKTNGGGFGTIVDFEFKDGFIYILDSKRLYRASYQIPQEYLIGN